MSRRIRPLTLDDLPGLGEEWARSVWFAVDPVTRRGLDAQALFDVKHRWFADVSAEWGSPGLVLPGLGEEQIAGYVVFAPAGLVPGRDVPPTAPASPDAALLLEVWVPGGRPGPTAGKLLVQAAVAALVRRGDHAALEAYAEVPGRGPARAAGSGELPALALLESVGFHVKRDHPTTPRMRLEFRGVRSWLTGAEERWERLLEGVRGHKEPAAGTPAAGPVRSAHGAPGGP